MRAFSSSSEVKVTTMTIRLWLGGDKTAYMQGQRPLRGIPLSAGHVFKTQALLRSGIQDRIFIVSCFKYTKPIQCLEETLEKRYLNLTNQTGG